ncbi:Smr/MutS family protein [Sneathiella limimaris]|uniref:Smr/MutS family protein n=1 Tax=Sneathiella limimaris TaxID=1964213 RepID=UPI00146F3254|nr:Smr/MutS family protein [Sneathiella limimaris]
MSSEDQKLWQHVTGEIQPISSNRYTPFEDELKSTTAVPKKVAGAKKAGEKEVQKLLKKRLGSGGKASTALYRGLEEALEGHSARKTVDGIDRNTSERLRRGRMEIEGRIDLHGHTRKEAHSRLKFFLHSSHRQGKRCVLVITGKGSSLRQTDDADYMGGNRKGVLRQEFPRWLKEPDLARYILDVRPAQPRHGGGGAFYVLLRRNRQSGSS